MVRILVYYVRQCRRSIAPYVFGVWTRCSECRTWKEKTYANDDAVACGGSATVLGLGA